VARKGRQVRPEEKRGRKEMRRWGRRRWRGREGRRRRRWKKKQNLL
jgi:hypothetical protein